MTNVLDLSVMDMDTPAVLVDLDALSANLDRMAVNARQAGVKLRPHIKTHKSIWIAQEQLKRGSFGITTAKLAEAEIMADAGFSDILIAYPIVGQTKLKRLGLLLERCSVTVSVDDVLAAKGVSDLGETIHRRIPLYIDVNSGLNRCGREPGEETAQLVRDIIGFKGIRFTGLMTHAGHAYGQKSMEDIRAVAKQEAESLLLTQKILAKYSIDVEEVSVGSTPTSRFISEQSGVTEMRPGAYVFGDGMQLSLGLLDSDQCAMHVLTSVISKPRKGIIIIDAGSKTLSSDLIPNVRGYGTLKGHPEVMIERLSEEHGIVSVPDHMEFHIGDKLQFLPNHCCVVTNLHQQLYGVRHGCVKEIITVDARGAIT